MDSPWKGLTTRSVLVTALLAVITGVTVISLLVVRARLNRQVLQDFSEDLRRSVEIFRAEDAQRLAALRSQNALLADLPSLKALMTTGDARTIADGGVRFWETSNSDLLALATNDGRVVAAYTRAGRPNADLPQVLSPILNAPISAADTSGSRAEKHFILAGGTLYEFSVEPLFFGNAESGTLLGYVINGYAVDDAFVRGTRYTSAAQIAFVSGAAGAQKVVATTLTAALSKQLRSDLGTQPQASPETLQLGGERFLASSVDLSPAAFGPLRLVVLKSFARANQTLGELNRLLLGVGAFSLLTGLVLMLAVSRQITAPLELLTRSAMDYGRGAAPLPSARGGTREVRALSEAFCAMSLLLEERRRALLQAERLATIGRMASSVSHDLRHYLAAVYANAEFLATSPLSDEERAELFDEIRTAVHGTTDLIDSLLIFSRSSGAVQRKPEPLAHLLQRAVALVRAHPDAAAVEVSIREGCEPAETFALVDAREVERALYNLLLNACQVARKGSGPPSVMASLAVSEATVDVEITDNGVGVAPAIRESLFEPFVSEGKQNGTGLGLTIANVIARDHGGSVRLIGSRPGNTVFLFSVARLTQEHAAASPQSRLETTL